MHPNTAPASIQGAGFFIENFFADTMFFFSHSSIKVKGGEQYMVFVKDPDERQQKDAYFTYLVEQYQTPLVRMCCLYLRDAALAEDAVQETFVKVYRHLGDFRGDCSEKTWVLRIAMNTCHDLRRSGWFRLMDRRYTPEMLPEVGTECTVEDDTLITAVMHLPPKLREVVLLYYYQGMTTLEIADALRLNQSSVSGRLKRARDKLRIELGKEGASCGKMT